MAPTARNAAGRSRVRSIALTLASVVAGGVIGWSAVFVGLAWGLLLGLAVTAILLGRLGLSDPRSSGLVVSFGFAFLLLTWPLLWLAVGYVRFLITGEPIEND